MTRFDIGTSRFLASMVGGVYILTKGYDSAQGWQVIRSCGSFKTLAGAKRAAARHA